MIISRAPFRISFFGGGTDYPVWYNEHRGAVLAATIDKYCYVTVRDLPPFFKYRYRIRYTKREETQTVSEIKHPSVRECLASMSFNLGVEIQHNADLPAMIGVGSSSSFTVCLLNALYALKGKMVTKRQLALEAIDIEQNRIKENVGSQDQTMAAFGGLNRIEFGGQYGIQVQPVTIDSKKLQLLNDHLLLFFTGFARTASKIAGEQIQKTHMRETELKRMYEMVDEAITILNGSNADITDFGRLIHESWMIKRSLTRKITTPHIDELYERGKRAGALGGKLLGAGGGGCILFFVEPDRQRKVKEALEKSLYIPFEFENLGAQIIYYAPRGDF